MQCGVGLSENQKCGLIYIHKELLAELTCFLLAPNKIHPSIELHGLAGYSCPHLKGGEVGLPPCRGGEVRWRGEVEGESWGASPSHYPPIQSWQARVQCRAGREFPQAVISSLGLPATAHCSPTLQPTIPSLHSQTLPLWSHHCPLKDQIHPVHNRHVYNVLKKFYPAGI